VGSPPLNGEFVYEFFPRVWGFPRVFKFFSAGSRLLRGDCTREISSRENYVEENPVVFVVSFIEGFGRGQPARAYSRPFT
jgi:hypothetical protein